MLGVFPPLGPPFLFIMKVGAFKRRIENNYSKVVRAFSFYFIKILINLL